jgi:uncharacterized protein involved in exopolysaccharide biosynthesis
MNPRYRQTFSRHRVLFSLPLILTTALALWYVLGAPKLYESDASLWVDTPAPQQSSLAQANAFVVTPATQAQQLLDELLTTRTFRVDIARRGPLAKYLEATSPSGWGPTALLAKLKGPQSLDGKIIAALGPKNVLTTVAGPQVLAVAVRSTSPTVAAGTLRALIASFGSQRTTFSVERAQAAVAYFRNQAQAAQRALGTARTAIEQYIAANPGASPTATATSAADAQMRSLTEAEKVASTRYAASIRAANQASVSLAATGSDPSSFRVIDPPTVPAGPVSGKKKEIMAVFGGIFVGALLSLLCVVLASGGNPEAAPEAASSAEEESGDETAELRAPEPSVAVAVKESVPRPVTKPAKGTA